MAKVNKYTKEFDTSIFFSRKSMTIPLLFSVLLMLLITWLVFRNPERAFEPMSYIIIGLSFAIAGPHIFRYFDRREQLNISERGIKVINLPLIPWDVIEDVMVANNKKGCGLIVNRSKIKIKEGFRDKLLRRFGKVTDQQQLVFLNTQFLALNFDKFLLLIVEKTKKQKHGN